MRRRTIDRDIDRILARLRDVIREQGYTQLEVQEALGWGRSYISQLVTKQKSLRVDQVLMILKVVNADPGELFGEVFQFGDSAPGRRAAPSQAPEAAEMRQLGMLFEGLVGALKKKNFIDAAELAAAIKRAGATT